MKSFYYMENRLTVSESQILCEFHFILDGGGNVTALASICYQGKLMFGDGFFCSVCILLSG